jgi:hypothetical protein
MTTWQDDEERAAEVAHDENTAALRARLAAAEEERDNMRANNRRLLDDARAENDHLWGKIAAAQARADVWQRALHEALARVAELEGEQRKHSEIVRDVERAHEMSEAQRNAETTCIPITNHRGEQRIMRLATRTVRVHTAPTEHHPGDGLKITGWDVDRQAERTIEVAQVHHEP